LIPGKDQGLGHGFSGLNRAKMKDVAFDAFNRSVFEISLNVFELQVVHGLPSGSDYHTSGDLSEFTQHRDIVLMLIQHKSACKNSVNGLLCSDVPHGFLLPGNPVPLSG